MGSTVSSSISRIEVSRDGTERYQCVEYYTPDYSSCTFRVIAGEHVAGVSLKDYTFDREGTKVEIILGNKGSRGGDAGHIYVKHRGSALEVRNDADQFRIGYGVPHVRCGFLVASKHYTESHGSTLFVTHMYGSTVEQRMLSLAVMQVWYDPGKGSYVCDLIGPSQHSSIVQMMLAMRIVYGGCVSDSASPTGQQTTITAGLVNNTGGPVYGILNGAVIINFFNVYLNYI